MLEAETYWSGAGKRVFNAFIQGRQVLTNFDIYAAAGGMNKPLTLVFTNAVTNSQLQVLFTPVVDNARISGLQVPQDRRRGQRHRRHPRLVAAGLLRPRPGPGERPLARRMMPTAMAHRTSTSFWQEPTRSTPPPSSPSLRRQRSVRTCR